MSLGDPLASSRSLFFDPEPGWDFSQYNDLANELESGFGLGMTLYDAPGMVVGGTQVNVDTSKTEVKPNVIVEAAKNPSWWLVAIGLFALYIHMRKRGGS